MTIRQQAAHVALQVIQTPLKDKALKGFFGPAETFASKGNPTDDDIAEFVTAHSSAIGAYKVVFKAYSAPEVWKKLPARTRSILEQQNDIIEDQDLKGRQAYRKYRNQLESKATADAIIKGLKMVLL